jgi:hypothetical protein
VRPLQGDGTIGVYLAGAFGEVAAFGDAEYHGGLSHDAIESPVLGIAATPSGEGYWLMEAAGRVHPFGDAAELGSPSLPAAEYSVGLAATPSGKGYWLASQTGAVYAVGDAGFFGAAVGTLGPDVDVIGLAATPTARGYWLLDSAGGVHAFGDAAVFGSAGPHRYPVTGLAPTPSGKGYWLVDATGGVFSFGDAAAFEPDTTYSAYGTDYALQDAVLAVETAPFGHGFAYGRLHGGFGARGVSLPMGQPASYGYGGGGLFQEGSFAVDLAFNVPPQHPAPGGGTVTRRGQPGLRTPQVVCVPTTCVQPEPPVPLPAVPALPPRL